MTDDITGIFDDLSPEDFKSTTTAFTEISRTNVGLDAFNAFVDEQLRAVQISYATAKGDMAPVAVLANDSIQRLYVPSDEETLQNYLDRLSEEAKQMGATWFFISRPTQVGSHLVGSDEVHDATTAETIQEAKEQGALQRGLFWYADRREDERQKRMGIYFDNGAGVLERPIEVPGTMQSAVLLEAVLG